MPEEDAELDDLCRFYVRCPNEQAFTIEADGCYIDALGNLILFEYETGSNASYYTVASISVGNWLSIVDHDNIVKGTA